MNVYLDHAASAPVRPEALAAFTAALGVVGNPSSTHADGRAARAVLEDARERLAGALDAHPTDVVFTAGGTESVNLAIKGLYWRGRNAGRDRVVSSPAEHPATLDALEWLRGQGATVDFVAVDKDARVVLSEGTDGVLREGMADVLREGTAGVLGEGTAGAGPTLVEALEGRRDVAVLSLLWANNEVGTIEDTDAIADFCAEVGVPLHWDAIAAVGKVPVSFRRSGATALSLSGHKLGAPIGTGALLIRRGHEPEALLHGGQQQAGRSGTVDVAGAAALAVAAELAVAELERESARLGALGERLRSGLLAAVPDARLSGPADPAGRLPGHVHATIPGVLGETLLFVLDQAGYSVSVGSACRAGVAEPSHVLRAMGLDETAARSGLRITLGRTTTEADVDAFIAALPAAVAAARAAS